MTFAHLTGHTRIAGYLEKMLATDRVPSVLLFVGPEGVGKRLFAEAFAAVLLEQKAVAGKPLYHPDFLLLKPEGKVAMHSMATIRRMVAEVGFPPYSAKRRVIILDDADRMLPYSSNALLKTLEEPPPYCHFLLIASKKEALLPTIVSRCQTIYFGALSQEEVAQVLVRQHAMPQDIAACVAAQSQGSASRALRCQSQAQATREELLWNAVSHTHSYPELVARIKDLQDWLEEEKKIWTQEIQKELVGAFPEGTSAALFEKEIEGAVALRSFSEFCEILASVEKLYRDLHLLSVKGKKSFLFYQARASELEGLAASRFLPSLEAVVNAIDRASLAYQRHIGFAPCLEALFLELQSAC